MSIREKILFACTLALALGIFAYALLGPGGGKQARLQAELRHLKTENESLKDQNHRLGLEVNALKERRDYLEKLARDELGLLKRDEVIIQLPDESGGLKKDQGKRD